MTAKPTMSFDEFLQKSAELIEQKCPYNAPHQDACMETCLPEQQAPREASYSAEPNDRIRDVVEQVHGPVYDRPRTPLPTGRWRQLSVDQGCEASYRTEPDMFQGLTERYRRDGIVPAYSAHTYSAHRTFLARVKARLRPSPPENADNEWMPAYNEVEAAVFDSAQRFHTNGYDIFNMTMPMAPLRWRDFVAAGVPEMIELTYVTFPLNTRSHSFDQVVTTWSDNINRMTNHSLRLVEEEEHACVSSRSD